MSPDLEDFIDELRNVRDPRGAVYDRYIAATENALRTIDKVANSDAAQLEKLDEIRAIVRRKRQSPWDRLEACQPILEAIRVMADEKAHLARMKLSALRNKGR
ncbi:MAG: hypothetical protein WAL39_06875 [Xanthobacteraceae bacterium]